MLQHSFNTLLSSIHLDQVNIHEKLFHLQILDCYQTTLEESKHATINNSNSPMEQDTRLHSSSRFLHTATV
ncbi:MAG: hypothetical protein AAFY76_19200, partial [Cyanobacteria bacterium J06649_11]